jgi:lipoprotein-anchoring transpeptidase ErfK/SrfK
MSRRLLVCPIACLATTLTAWAQPAVVDGITFIDRPNEIQIPARQAAKLLGWRIATDPKTHGLKLNNQPIRASQTRKLYDGTLLVGLSALRAAGATVNPNKERGTVAVKRKGKVFFVRSGKKRVVVNRERQELRAFQGGRLVLKAPVSTGKEGYATPIGTWHLKPYRNKMHKSKLYDNAPMPWSVQVAKDIFIHGAGIVNGVPSSHGCIRLPTGGRNAARWFYYWVETGTPVTIAGAWPRRFRGS